MHVSERKLMDAMKKIKNLEKVNQQLTALNEKYRKLNEDLNASKERDAEQLQNLRSAFIESQSTTSNNIERRTKKRLY